MVWISQIAAISGLVSVSENGKNSLMTVFSTTVRKAQRQETNSGMGQSSIVFLVAKAIVSSAFHLDQIVMNIKFSQKSTVDQVR
jgi:hypothetical protein